MVLLGYFFEWSVRLIVVVGSCRLQYQLARLLAFSLTHSFAHSSSLAHSRTRAQANAGCIYEHFSSTYVNLNDNKINKRSTKY